MNILYEKIAASNLHYNQMQLRDFGIKYKVPRLCDKTCKNKKSAICNDCDIDLSKYESISYDEYKKLMGW